MSTPARRVVQAGDALARERLAAYARYADLLAEQEHALEQGDLESFHTLARAAAELQGSIQGVLAEEAGTPASVADRVSEILLVAVARSERIQERIRRLRGDVGAELRGMSGERSRARRYLGGADAGQGSSFDARL